MTHKELLDLWPSGYVMGKETGIPINTCNRWRREGCVPKAEYWPKLINTAMRHGRLDPWACDDLVFSDLALNLAEIKGVEV